MKKRTKWLVWLLVVVAVLGVAAYGSLHVYRLMVSNVVPVGDSNLVFLRSRISVDSLVSLLDERAEIASPRQLRQHARMMKIDSVPAGCYKLVDEGDRSLLHRFAGGWQEPVHITFNNVRTPNQLAARLAAQLLCDSASFAAIFADSAVLSTYGVDCANLFFLFIPNTYEVYWTITPDQLLSRMKRECNDFWTDTRLKQAAHIGLTPHEVVTLASIVGSETRNVAEMPTVAGLYLNRLRRGMLLQSDPTVIYAVGDFTIRRVLREHLEVNSPYNTYQHRGLPPGPIMMPTTDNIKAVLGASEHNYLYMCAKETFDGTHNFAVSYGEHMANARRYQAALNARGIKR